MKRRTLAVALCGASLFAVSSAAALPLNQHGSSFFASRGVDEQFLNHLTNGVQNTTNVPKAVVSTPARNPHSSGNQTLAISGWNSNATVNTRCSIYTYRPDASLVASRTFCIGSAAGCIVPPASGQWTRSESFSLADAPPTASYYVYCTLLAAGANTNRLQSVRLLQ
jgi:hypothetical protein